MSSVVIFNLGASPQNVIQCIPSGANASAYNGRSDVLIDADISSVIGKPLVYWKVIGSAVSLMNSSEQATVDVALATQFVLVQRSDGIAMFSSINYQGIALRAIGGVLVDEINLVREWFVSFQAQVALASSLADLKTRVATLPNMPDRTLAQFNTALIGKINSGGAD